MTPPLHFHLLSGNWSYFLSSIGNTFSLDYLSLPHYAWRTLSSFRAENLSVGLWLSCWHRCTAESPGCTAESSEWRKFTRHLCWVLTLENVSLFWTSHLIEWNHTLHSFCWCLLVPRHGKMIRNCVTSLNDILSHVCNTMTGGLHDSRFHVSHKGDRRQKREEGNKEKFKNCSYVNADEHFPSTFFFCFFLM